MNRIYQNTLLTVGSVCTLDKMASGHVLQALRMRIGDELVVFNGRGGEYRARIKSAAKAGAEIELLQFNDVQREPPVAVHLGQCLSRGERMDYAIQKSVEVGVAEITPLFSKRSNVNLATERVANRMRHWQQIIISACEQSGRTLLPVLHEPVPIDHWITKLRGNNFICDFQSGIDDRYNLTSANILIGPEGGFDPLEVALAHQHGFKSFYLGPLTLRTETAPVVAITMMQVKDSF